MPVSVKRLPIKISPSHKRVLLRPFVPGEDMAQRIFARITALSPADVDRELKMVFVRFEERHHDIKSVLLRHYDNVKHWTLTDRELSRAEQLLIGAYFTQEYALESAALFNPSIVAHPNQTGLKDDETRFVLSLRATGEGHISSVVFREGVIRGDNTVDMRDPAPYVTEPHRVHNAKYERQLFARKLGEMGANPNEYELVLSNLGSFFTLAQLEESVDNARQTHPGDGVVEEALDLILALADSNYEVEFSVQQRTSERTIFPSSRSQRNGVEDARFVRFSEDDGSVTYFATYTAYDGRYILPQLLQTDDFLHFRFATLNGPAVKNKGMALFPRRINGLYAMLSRQDNENLFLMYSENVHFWYKPVKIVRPTFPWEFVQLGNCGSPIELDEGWLVLSHGVGAMRRYCIGAFLLDKKNPAKVIGRLRTPLLQPNENEREGYVPNVVYTCGAIQHGANLVIPYAMSDYASTFAIVSIHNLLNEME